MVVWNGLGQAATLAQLAGVDAGGLISMIIHSAQTVKQNKEECRQIVQDVMVISALVQEFQRLQMMRFPVIRAVLGGLQDTLRQVHELVTSSQKRNIMYSFCMAGNQAQKFRDVRDRIKFYLELYPMISHIHITYLSCGLYSRLDPSGNQPQALEEVLESFASHPNPDSTSAVNSEITISATGSRVPCAPLSGIAEFTLSTLVATTQHFPKESITEGGGHSQVTMQKIVIKIHMTGCRCRTRAMVLAAKFNGVNSVTMTGDGMDILIIGGVGVDSIYLVSRLRRKVGPALIMPVEEARLADKATNRRGGFRSILSKLSKFMWPRARRSVSPPPPSPRRRVERTDDNPGPAASGGGPSSHLFSVPSTSTAVSAACTQEHLARNPSASAQRQDLSRAADLPPVTDDELAAVEAGFVLEDYVAMFDGPMPPAVIAALAGAVFHLDDEDGIPMGNA